MSKSKKSEFPDPFEKARLEKEMDALQHNYNALCRESKFADLRTSHTRSDYGDHCILTASVHSALRPFAALCCAAVPDIRSFATNGRSKGRQCPMF